MVNLNNTLWDKKLESLLLKYDAEVQEIEELYEKTISGYVKCWLAVAIIACVLVVACIMADAMVFAVILMTYGILSACEIVFLLDQSNQL